MEFFCVEDDTSPLIAVVEFRVEMFHERHAYV